MRGKKFNGIRAWWRDLSNQHPFISVLVLSILTFGAFCTLVLLLAGQFRFALNAVLITFVAYLALRAAMWFVSPDPAHNERLERQQLKDVERRLPSELDKELEAVLTNTYMLPEGCEHRKEPHISELPDL